MKGLYRGVTITALRDTGYGAYFATVGMFHYLNVWAINMVGAV